MPDSVNLDHNTICKISLKAEQWEIVLKSLGKLPYELSAPIIQTIVTQLMTAAPPKPYEHEQQGSIKQ